MTKEEMIAALDAAEEIVRRDDQWQYDSLRNAEANGACRALDALRQVLTRKLEET